MKRRSKSETPRKNKCQKDKNSRSGSISGESVFPLPRLGDLLELRWTLDSDSVRGEEDGSSKDLSVWWPAVVAGCAGRQRDLIYTVDPQPHDASELVRWKQGYSEDESPDVVVEKVLFTGNIANHLLSGDEVVWRFATWRGENQTPASAQLTEEVDGFPPGKVTSRYAAVASAQEALSKEVAGLRSTLTHAAGPYAGALREAATTKHVVRRILRVFMRAAVEEALRGGTPQAMRILLEKDRRVVFGTFITSKKADCTLGEFRDVFNAILADAPENGSRVSAYPSAHALYFPSPRQTGSLKVRFQSYGDLCDVLCIPLHSRSLKAGKTRKDDAIALVGTCVSEKVADRDGSARQATRIMVGHSCADLLDDSCEPTPHRLPGRENVEVVCLYQSDSTYCSEERRSGSSFVVQKSNASEIREMERFECDESEERRHAIFYDDPNESASYMKDLTFDLCWSPLPVPPGSAFEAGAVPGAIIARIPVVVVTTNQLVHSVEQQLLADDGGVSNENVMRTHLRHRSVCPPAKVSLGMDKDET